MYHRENTNINFLFLKFLNPRVLQCRKLRFGIRPSTSCSFTVASFTNLDRTRGSSNSVGPYRDVTKKRYDTLFDSFLAIHKGRMLHEGFVGCALVPNYPDNPQEWDPIALFLSHLVVKHAGRKPSLVFLSQTTDSRSKNGDRCQNQSQKLLSRAERLCHHRPRKNYGRILEFLTIPTEGIDATSLQTKSIPNHTKPNKNSDSIYQHQHPATATMSFTSTVAKSVKHAVARPGLVGRRGGGAGRRSFSSSAEFSCCESAEFAAPPPALSGRSPPRVGHRLNLRRREQLSVSLGRANAAGRYSPLADAVSRIKQLRFSSSSKRSADANASPRARARAAARMAFRASIVDRCSLSPP